MSAKDSLHRVVTPGAALAAAFAAALWLFAPLRAEAAIQISYTLENTADSTPGEDLWRYDYTVSGHTFQPGEAFEIFFPKALFTSLSIASLPSGWDAAIAADDPFFPDASFVAGATETRIPSQQFAVAFAWLGGPSQQPGSQRFFLYDESFSVIEDSATVPATVIPEPATSLLVLAGGAAVTAMTRRRRSKQARR